jgi:hypothetical protein
MRPQRRQLRRRGQKIAASGRFEVRPIGFSGNPFGPIRRSAAGIRSIEVSGMTIKHEVWLADALGGSAMLVALYFVLREFASARLP